MGTYVQLNRLDYSESKDWDWGLAGSRQFLKWSQDLSYYHPEGANLDPWAEDYKADLYRPENIDEWRKAMPEDQVNYEHWQRMFDLLEADPDLWIYVSY